MYMHISISIYVYTYIRYIHLYIYTYEYYITQIVAASYRADEITSVAIIKSGYNEEIF